jgi:hypothetical protein
VDDSKLPQQPQITEHQYGCENTLQQSVENLKQSLEQSLAPANEYSFFFDKSL